MEAAISGAPRSSMDLASVLRRRWVRYRREVTHLMREGPVEPMVHDCRVAARRMMVLLRLVEGPPRIPGVRGLRRRVRSRFRALAPLRDLHVERELAVRRSGELPALKALARHLAAKQKRIAVSTRKAFAACDLKEEEQRFVRVHAHLSGGGSGTLRAVHANRLSRRVCAVANVAQEALVEARQGEINALHALRVALKNLRYLLEVQRALTENGAAHSALRTARRWQGRLGRLQDLAILRNALARFLANHSRPDGPAALAQLDAELSQAAHAAARGLSRLQPQLLVLSRDTTPALP